MLDLFRTNQLLFSILLLFYAAVLHIAVFVVPSDWQPTSHGYLSKAVYEWIGYAGTVPNIVVILLLSLHATILNAMVANNRLDDIVTLFPGLFYILFASAIPSFLYLSPLHLANTFYIIALYELFKVYKKPSAADNIFNVGFWVAVGSLFYFSYAIFILVGMIGLNILRAFSLQERLMILCGALVPYVLVGVYAFWVDEWAIFLQQQFVNNVGFLSFQVEPGIETILKIVFVDLFLLVAIFSYGLYQLKKNIQVQKKISVLYWGLLCAGLTLIFQAGIRSEHLLTLAVPLGIMISINFTSVSKRWAEILHLLIVLVVLIFQYQQYLLPE